MNKTTQYKCEHCQKKYKPSRTNQRFCKNESCKKERQKKRWEDWRLRRENEGTYREKSNEYQKRFRQKTGYHKDYDLRKKYGISLDEWMVMVEEVEGRCQICSRTDRPLCVDHDHLTNQIRGVLCSSCNRAIGQLGDTHEHLQRALDYLLQAKER